MPTVAIPPKRLVWCVAAIVVAHSAAISAGELPTVAIEHDDTVITTSAILVPSPSPIADTDGDGVVHIRGDDITVDFAGHVLSGADASTDPDHLTGIGVSVVGRNITIRGGGITGYKVAIHAADCPGLVIEDFDVSGNFRQRLGSTPQREDAADWLFPHDNDHGEWAERYGAGVWVEDSAGVTLRRIRARRGQNGIILDCVTDSQVYDNDCSFLSGWGLAMWRCTGNVISRNAFDFCIRGYSHGVYNRGQDSAGILMFEQNCDNIIAENSATHCGDGLFAFAGQEVLGQKPPDDLAGDELIEWCVGRGNNRNLIIANDLSYAAAHGLELTFSFDNRIIRNRLAHNAICGIWAGYSQETDIVANTIQANGDMAYGLERGGINIEHGYANRIQWNAFKDNACGIHLWWDPDEGLMQLPWAKANERGSSRNFIARNTFDGDTLALQLRQCTQTIFAGNRLTNVEQEVDATDSDVIRDVMLTMEMFAPPPYTAHGEIRPVGARPKLRGRDKIIMTQWGPYDWQSPQVVFAGVGTDEQGRPMLSYRLLGDSLPVVKVEAGRGLTVRKRDGAELRIIATEPGVHRADVSWEDSDGKSRMDVRYIIAADWVIRVFPYQTDPREDANTWRSEAGDDPYTLHAHSLDLRYGMGGLDEAAHLPVALPSDHFGTIAETTMPMPAGRWRISTVSDDGVRVWVNDELVIDNWTWHGPTEDSAVLTLDEAQAVLIRVEHFELDGYAILMLDIEPAD
ncbi:MAG: right-handed parallel beta-helix repeat-containing protein [Phycisphaerales bacterium]|nr:right-handed parallel beta-helix repeat-containing protein [Phycisphaerales bacterium]